VDYFGAAEAGAAAGAARRDLALEARGAVVLVFVELEDADDREGLAVDLDGLAEGLGVFLFRPQLLDDVRADDADGAALVEVDLGDVAAMLDDVAVDGDVVGPHAVDVGADALGLALDGHVLRVPWRDHADVLCDRTRVR